MDRPPRDLSEDRLIDGTLIRYAYLIAGMAQVCGQLHCARSVLGGASGWAAHSSATRTSSPVWHRCAAVLCACLEPQAGGARARGQGGGGQLRCCVLAALVGAEGGMPACVLLLAAAH